jgi:hypothetical protein
VTGRARVDASPLSAFVREMRQAFQRRSAGALTQRQAEAEYENIMRRYLGRDAWEVVPNVPRDTSADPSCPASRVQEKHNSQHGVDRKQLAAGDVE